MPVALASRRNPDESPELLGEIAEGANRCPISKALAAVSIGLEVKRAYLPMISKKGVRMSRSIFSIALVLVVMATSLLQSDAKSRSHHHARKHHHHKHHRILFIRT